MRITKHRLKRIIKEEKKKVLTEADIVTRQANLLSDLDKAASRAEETANGLYGLQDPGDPGLQVGDELAIDLEGTVEMLNNLYAALELYFDDEAGRNPGGSIG